MGPGWIWPKTKPTRPLRPGPLCWPTDMSRPLDPETWSSQQIERMGWEGTPLNSQPRVARYGEAIWPPRVNSHHHIKAKFERERVFICSFRSLSSLKNSELLCNSPFLSVVTHDQHLPEKTVATDQPWRRRLLLWRPPPQNLNI